MTTRRGMFAAALIGTIAATATSSARAQSNSMTLKRWAWAGVSARIGDVEVFIDARAPNAEEDAPGPALTSDAPRRFALATHHHGDHLDLAALTPLLGERGYLVVEENVARLFDNRRVNVQPVRMFEPVYLSRGNAEFVAFAVPAVDALGSPQNSWVLIGGGKRIIHCGDTGWHGGWWDIGRAYGPFDVAFLPINGARPVAGRFTDPGLPMIMNAEQAAAAAAALGARSATPIHYGAMSTPDYVQDVDALQRFERAARRVGVAVRSMRPGDELRL